MTDHPADLGLSAQLPFTLSELARDQHVTPVATADDLRAEELWESDAELDAFLADLVATRHAPPA